YCISFLVFKCQLPTFIYTLSLHDALPIYQRLPGERERNRRPSDGSLFGRRRRRRVRSGLDGGLLRPGRWVRLVKRDQPAAHESEDRKSTRLNSSHVKRSYAVFCLKKNKKQ